MSGRKLLGLLIIALGVVALLNTIGILDVKLGQLFINYWPVLLIIIGAFHILTNPTAKTGGLIVLTIGVLFQLRVSGYLDVFDFHLIWPLIVIFIGARLLFPRKDRWKENEHDAVNAFALFSGSNVKNLSQNFSGGDATALFGGLEIDLRGAQIAQGQEAVIELFSAFGGIVLYVPRDWHLIVRGTPVFGGIDNRAENAPPEENVPTLKVNGFVLFGGIEIKN